jgi:sigma-B regulation protein RsbU (phosphoserine phosphatase)
MGHAQTIIPAVSEIMHFVPAISSDTMVREVMELFQKDQSLLALPIADDGQFSGVINRKALFFEHLGRPFAVDLYGRKAIRVLLTECQLTLDPDLDINSALIRLLEVDPGLTIDSFPVVAGSECKGIVAVSDLMMKISENQAMLLTTLKLLSSRITEEVAKASKIQRDLLPLPEFSADGIGIIPLGEGRMGLVVADVSGHGVQAGMVTTAAKASLHSLIGQGVTTPAALLYGMNNAILATARQSLLMTCLIDWRQGDC